MAKKTPTPVPAHPLIGRWFHTFEEIGGQRRVKYQGTVLATAENGVLVQLFEWFWGDASSQHWFPWSAVEDWDFYASAKAMNAAYDAKYKPKDIPIAGIDYPSPSKPS